MLYIFDLGNVLIDIDFNRALGVFSHLSATPLAVLQNNFKMDEPFFQHEKGLISDEVFAEALNKQLGIHLNYEQFLTGWQALLIQIRPDILKLLADLKSQEHTIVMLSNTNNAHTCYWKSAFKDLLPFFDKIFLSHEINMRKPDIEIYQYVLDTMQVNATDAVFFDDNEHNINSARTLGIEAVLIDQHATLINYFKDKR